MSTTVKHAVSKKKRRFIAEGFDLDLAYITDNIIAMGFPASGKEALYRNSWVDTKRFLDTRHPGHYRLYNLCSERDYDPAKFDGNVAKFPFDDHNPSPLQLLVSVCRDIEAYLSADPLNLAAIHCKAGKGRTGVVICSYMIYTRHFPRALDSMAFYGAMRTHDQKGVTIPSQRRYVSYFEQVCERGGVPTAVEREVLSLDFSAYPKLGGGGFKPVVEFSYDGDRPAEWDAEYHAANWPPSPKCRTDKWKAPKGAGPVAIPTPGIRIQGHTKVEVFNGKQSIMHMWIHTGFCEDELVLKKEEIDDAKRDCKTHSKYPADFTVTFRFAPLAPEHRPTFPGVPLRAHQNGELQAAAVPSCSSSEPAAHIEASTSSSSSSSSAHAADQQHEEGEKQHGGADAGQQHHEQDAAPASSGKQKKKSTKKSSSDSKKSKKSIKK